MKEIRYYCDKCESENVETRIVKDPAQIERRPMSSMPHPDRPMAVPAVFTINHYEVHCKDCGHTVTLPYDDGITVSYGSTT
jgi:uncharacterized Zn finger protein